MTRMAKRKVKDEDAEIGFIELRGQRLYVRVRAWNGKHNIDIRMHYEDDNGEWKPTKKGVSVPIVDEVPDDFYGLVGKAMTYIEENDL